MVMDNVIAQNAVMILLQSNLYLQPPLHNRYFFCPGGQKKLIHTLTLYWSPRWLDTVMGDETARTYVPIDINPFITHPAHEGLCHTTGVYAPYSLWTAVWGLLHPTRIKTEKELWHRAYSLSLSEKTRKSNRLQMSQQRQHILLRCFKTSGGWPLDNGHFLLSPVVAVVKRFY